MKTQLTTLDKASRTCAMTMPVSGRKPVLALLMRLFGAAVLVVPAFGAQAAVVFTTLYSFTVGNHGAHPQAGLVQGSDGNFYGTTYVGGTNNGGTVFQITTNGALTTLYSFALPGELPSAGLVEGSDGNFYGTTYCFINFFGELLGWGTVFKISTKGALATLHSFGSICDTNGFPLDGGNPEAALVQGSDGNFYGTTFQFGTNVYGTVFKISTNGTFASLYSFGSICDTNGVPLDGANPQAALVQGRDGNFYGTTFSGGTNNGGTVFKITPNGALTSLYTFTGGYDGAGPNGLVQGSDGNFYGTTYGDMWHTNGTVFRLTIVPEPPLTIIPSQPYVILVWPTNYAGFSCAGFTLQSTTNLGSSAVWTTNSPHAVVVNGQNTVTNRTTGRQQFFRLIQ